MYYYCSKMLMLRNGESLLKRGGSGWSFAKTVERRRRLFCNKAASGSILRVCEDDKNTTTGHEDDVMEGELIHGVSSVRGMRLSMEDRYDTFSPDKGESLYSLFGVYDGHAGHNCADFLSKVLINVCHDGILKGTEKNRRPEEVIKEHFLELDRQFCTFAQGTNMQDGSTALLALIERSPYNGFPTNLWMANTGDSRGVVVRKSGTVKQLTREHSPSLEDERSRVENSGGFVKLVTNPFSASSEGTLRVDGMLAMTRAFGNCSMKPYVTAEPEITRRKIRKDDIYLCIATDGLWEVVRNEEVGEYLLRFGAKTGVAQLTKLAIERGSSDNVTVLAVKLNLSDFLPVSF